MNETLGDLIDAIVGIFVNTDATGELSGAFFEFSENSRKRHRFFIGVFSKLSFLFIRLAGVSKGLTLSDTPDFLLSESYHLERSEQTCVANKKGTG